MSLENFSATNTHSALTDLKDRSQDLSRFANAQFSPVSKSELTVNPIADYNNQQLSTVDHKYSSPPRQDIVIFGKHGQRDVVTGVVPEKDETVKDLVRRLYPDLSNDQIGSEVRQLVRYNRNYGNAISENSSLDPGKPVYLSSVKTRDKSGRVTKIESPTGRTTDLTYGADGKIDSYRISGFDGSVLEQLRRNTAGSYTLITRAGASQNVPDVDIDANGNVALIDPHGSRITHLSRGDDIVTQFKDDKATGAEIYRTGVSLGTYTYDYSGGNRTLFAIDANDAARRTMLDPTEDAQVMARIDACTTTNQFVQAGEPSTNVIDQPADVDLMPGSTALDQKVEAAAFATLNNPSTPPKCGWAVQDTWEHAGHPELDGKGNGWDMHEYLDTDPDFVSVDRATAMAAIKKGHHVAIVCRKWAQPHDGQEFGHSETLMADSKGAVIGVSFFKGAYDPNNPRYDGSQDRFYLPKVDIQTT